MSIAALAPDSWEYDQGRTAARRTLALNVFAWGLPVSLKRASHYIDSMMERTGGNVDYTQAGVLFEFNRFLDRHARHPSIDLDRVDRDAALFALPLIDSATPIELSAQERKRSPKNREGA